MVTQPVWKGNYEFKPIPLKDWACVTSCSSEMSGVYKYNCCIISGITKSYRDQGLDCREAEELSWCPSWSNSLWQGWSCGLVHCPGGNATDPIWRVLASSDGISSWTPLKPQHSNPYPNPLANQLWCSDFLTPSHGSHHPSETPCLP